VPADGLGARVPPGGHGIRLGLVRETIDWILETSGLPIVVD